jgi:hypothetical protein
VSCQLQQYQAGLQGSSTGPWRGCWRSSSNSSQWGNPLYPQPATEAADVDVLDVADATVRVVATRPKRPDTPAVLMPPRGEAAPAAAPSAASGHGGDAELNLQASYASSRHSDCSTSSSSSSQWAGRHQSGAQYAAVDDQDTDMADAMVRVGVGRPKRPDTPACAVLMRPAATAATAECAAAAAASDHGDSADTVQPMEQARCRTPASEPAPAGFKLWGKLKGATPAKSSKGQQPTAATQQQQKQGNSVKILAKGVAQQLSKFSKLWACGQSALAQVDVSAGGVQEAAAWSPVREALPIVAGC